ncbi:DUF6412 domain-containing protein [Streptomyces coryli]|uniref:DUF6412 domain-containing protein n=1 Tax=Streptomyces coryli TaxID=1128680 RepID=UPI0019D243FE|nr:DUF6412 domain-containing protein [Streptomyces coryli]
MDLHRYVAVCRVHLSALFLLLAGLLIDEGGFAAGFAGAAASAALVLLCSALAHAAAARPEPPGRVRTAIRDRELRTAFLPQRDPDAAGRPRPRAPGFVV